MGARVSIPTRRAPTSNPMTTPGVQLDDDVVAIDAERALALLDRITHDLPGGGESREGQREMVRSVAAAFSRRRTTVIEAGTGIGKSLAYLIPAVMSGQRVVVATATKNLQDQLAQKDAPTVAANAPGVRVAVLKGKQNYLCRNRAHSVGRRRRSSVSTTARTCPRAWPTRCGGSCSGRTRPRPATATSCPSRSTSARGAALGDAPGVSAPGELPPGSELLRRTREGPRRRVLDPHRQHPPLRVAPGVGLDAVAGARVRRLRRGPRDRRHLRLAARHLTQRHATARAGRRGATAARARVRRARSSTSSRSPTDSPRHSRSSTTATN